MYPEDTAAHLGTIKVAEIYIKKGALDAAVEVLNEILSEDPANALARQKLKEIQDGRNKARPVAIQGAEAPPQKSRRSSDDALSIMKSEDDEPIVDVSERDPASLLVPADIEEKATKGINPQLKEHIARFLQNHAIETSLLIGADGKLLDSVVAAGKDASALAGTALSIFSNTEKAAGRMNFGGLQQVIVTSADDHQIIFVRLKAAVLVAVTGKNTNLGILRIAINDLMKKG